MNKIKLISTVVATLALGSQAALVTSESDPRSWQGATVGTFATLYYGSNTAATRQLVVDNQLLDDGVFDATGYTTAALVANAWSTTPGAGGCLGKSLDATGTGSYGYGCGYGSLTGNANAIDDLWFQTGALVGQTVFDLGYSASKAAVFGVIDHGPLPYEAIESSVFLSNDMITWTAAQVERVWLEGSESNLGIQWDGFTYAVGTGTSATFRYASIIHGGPAALEDDGDNEINGMMGLDDSYHGTPTVPEPGTMGLMGMGFGLLSVLGLRRKKK